MRKDRCDNDCNLFEVKIESNKYDFESQENSITISVTHNGYQFNCISLSIEDAQVLRKKLGGWLDFFVD